LKRGRIKRPVIQSSTLRKGGSVRAVICDLHRYKDVRGRGRMRKKLKRRRVEREEGEEAEGMFANWGPLLVMELSRLVVYGGGGGGCPEFKDWRGKEITLKLKRERTMGAKKKKVTRNGREPASP